jgi:hypothetical protein
LILGLLLRVSSGDTRVDGYRGRSAGHTRRVSIYDRFLIPWLGKKRSA